MVVQRHPEAYVKFLAHFHGTRDYFECHELLEEHWKKETDPVLKGIWHGLIQVAVSLYHERRGNAAGAVKMMDQAVNRLSTADLHPVGLEAEALLELLRGLLNRQKRAIDGETVAYTDPELPVCDPDLLRQAQALCESWKADWNRPSPMEDPELIHRHTRRDRSGVIEERSRRLSERNRA